MEARLLMNALFWLRQFKVFFLRKKNRSGLSIIEVLVSMGIVSIMLMILVQIINVCSGVKNKYQPRMMILKDIEHFYEQLHSDMQRGVSFFHQESSSLENILLKGTVNITNIKTVISTNSLSWVLNIGGENLSCWGRGDIQSKWGSNYLYSQDSFRLSDQNASYGIREGGVSVVVYQIQSHPQKSQFQIIERREYLCDTYDMSLQINEQISQNYFFMNQRGSRGVSRIEQTYHQASLEVQVIYDIEVTDEATGQSYFYQVSDINFKERGLV